jgi:glutamate dehydrogenase (NAD(P)+)
VFVEKLENISKMLHLKNIVRSTPIAREMTKILPIAVTQSRGYADHQIPDRLKHIPSAENPKFFDMVSDIPIQKIDF